MNHLNIRFLIAISLVLGAYATVTWVRSGLAGAAVIIPPSKDLHGLPLELGNWQGKDHESDPQTVAVLAADVQVNRQYTNGTGGMAVLHAAVWTKDIDSQSIAPHHPSVCYPNAGWTVLDEKVINVEMPGGPLPICFLQMERGDQRVVTAHWFQMGTYRFTGGHETRSISKHFWRRAEWPPVVKVMLHVPAMSIAESLPNVQDLGARVYEFTRDL